MVFLDANIVLETTLKGRSKTEKALQLIADLGGQVAISITEQDSPTVRSRDECPRTLVRMANQLQVGLKPLIPRP